MQIKHIKNLYWFIFAIAVVLAIIFSSNLFVFWCGIITAILAIISIFSGHPIFLWLYGIYMFVISLPFAVPYLLSALFCKLFKRSRQESIYCWLGIPIGIGEFFLTITILKDIVYGICSVGIIFMCFFLVLGFMFDDKVKK